MFEKLRNIILIFFFEEHLCIWKYNLKVIQILQHSYFSYAVICGAVNTCQFVVLLTPANLWCC